MNKTELRKKKTSPELLFVLERCQAVGVAASVLNVLVENYSLERLQKQLAWLPSRKPRDRAAMFVRAVQEEWAQPAQYEVQDAEASWAAWLETEGSNEQGGEGLERLAPLASPVSGGPVPPRGRGLERIDFPIIRESKGDGEGKESTEARELVLPESGLDARQVWQRALQELEMQMTRVTFDTWLRGTLAVGVRANGIVVQVRDGYAVEWLQTRLSVAIRRTLAGIAGQPIDVHFEVAGGA